MSKDAEVRCLTLAGIAHRCATETALFFRRQANDPRFCFELFRRAIVDKDQRAWELAYRQYHPLVAGWAARHPAFPACGEELDYLVNCSFERMWAAVGPAKFDRLPDLRSLLRYLQMCVHSVIVDLARNAEPAVELPALETADLDGLDRSPPAEQASFQADRKEFWQAVERRLQSDKERRVVYGSFVLALKPRELLAHYPDTFSDVGEVYRVKENVLDRLRRDDELRRLLGLDA